MKQFDLDDELADIAVTAQGTKPIEQSPALQIADVSDHVKKATPPPQTNTAEAQASTGPAVADLGDIEDTPPTGSQHTKSGAKPDNTLAGEAIDWSDPELMKRGDGLARIRPDKNKKDDVKRLALIPDLPFRGARRHFITTKEGKRNLLCLATKENPVGYCCKALDEESQFHGLGLAVEYLNCNPKTGLFDKGADGKPPIPEVKLGFVDLSKANYCTISNLPEDDESIYNYDLVMSMDGNKYNFTVKSRKARWKLYPEVVAVVEEAVKRITADGGVKFFRKLGQKKTLLEWKQILSGQVGGAAESANLDEIEDV